MNEEFAAQIVKCGPILVFISGFLILLVTYFQGRANEVLSQQDKSELRRDYAAVLDATTKPEAGIERLIEERIASLSEAQAKVPKAENSDGLIARATERVAQYAEEKRIRIEKENEKQKLEEEKDKKRRRTTNYNSLRSLDPCLLWSLESAVT